MSGLVNGFSKTDTTVNAALEWIEGDLREALVTAVGRINSALEAPSNDNEVLHSHAADIHSLISTIDRNKRRRAEIARGEDF
jgi:hypothetical protein